MAIKTLNSRENMIIAQVLRELNPFVYESCIHSLNAPMKDIKLIPLVFDEIVRNYVPTPENAPAIIAIFYKLFAPYKLHLHSPRLPDGIRDAICKAMHWNNRPVCNHYNNIAMAYYKGERWSANIDKIANEILSDFEELNLFDYE